jgi:hypothetical protein
MVRANALLTVLKAEARHALVGWRVGPMTVNPSSTHLGGFERISIFMTLTPPSASSGSFANHALT